jgi:hypothetical protein
MTRTQIYIEEEMLQQAKITAQRKGLNLSQYIRDLISKSTITEKPTKPVLRITKQKSKKIVNISGNHNVIYDR